MSKDFDKDKLIKYWVDSSDKDFKTMEDLFRTNNNNWTFVLEDEEDKSFETEVKLMVIRNGEETLIEPHTFTKDEFINTMPIANQIINHGERIVI